MTPPKFPNYELNLPPGMEDKFAEVYPKLKKASFSVARHKVRRGETLSEIAKRYGISYRSIMASNNLRSTRIRQGQNLVIPNRKMGVSRSSTTKRSKTYATSNGTYRLRRGDSLWSVSRKFQVSVSQLKKWNNINNASRVYPGRRIHIKKPNLSTKRVAQSSAQAKISGDWINHTISSGDSLWSISRKYGANINDIVQWNELNPNDVTLFPGNSLRIKALNL